MALGSEATVSTGLPVQKPYVSTTVKKTIQLPNTVFSKFKESPRKPLNDKGYQFSLLENSNPNIGGGMNSGDTMLVGGSDGYVTLCVGTAMKNGARAWNGGNMRQMSDPNYFGMGEGEQMALDAKRFATEQEKDLCFSGITMSRGVIDLSVTAISYSSGADESTITFLSTKNGTYYLREMIGRSFLFHHPTTFVVHGGTTPFALKRITSATVAVFAGDITGGTAIATNDIIVPIGTADNHSSVNKGIRNLEYMTPVTGEYFTANVANHSKLKAIQFDNGGNEVTRATLQYMDDLYTFNYPDDPSGTKNHTDVFSPTQKSKMLFQIEGNLRINSNDGQVAYNPKTTYVGWNGRQMMEAVYLVPTQWFIFNFREAYRGVQKEFGVWNLDNQTRRAIPASGSIRDAVQEHYVCVDQVWSEDSRLNMLIIGCATAGAATAANV